MTIGVYITYRILNIADLSVEGSIAMGAAIAANGIYNGMDLFSQRIGLCRRDDRWIRNWDAAYPAKNSALLSGILTMIAYTP